MIYKSQIYRELKALFGESFSDGLDIVNGIIYGRIIICAVILSLFLVGNYIKGGINLVDLSWSQGVNFFDQHYEIKDYDARCTMLIDNSYNIIATKPTQSWDDPAKCVDYDKIQVFKLVFKHQMEARKNFKDIFWPYAFIAAFYFLTCLNAATGSFYVDKVNITPVALCIGWLVIAILLFPVLFRDHVPFANTTSNNMEYYSASVYLTDENKLVDCSTTFMGKLGHCYVRPHQ